MMPSPHSRPVDAQDTVAALVAEARGHRAANHPYLDALRTGDLPDPAWAIRDFARQYVAYSSGFQRYLNLVIAGLADDGHRKTLCANLAEEQGALSTDDEVVLEAAGIDLDWVRGVPHPVLYQRFLDALGLDRAWLDVNPPCDDAVVWHRTFLQICRGDSATAVGALGLGTEAVVGQVYSAVVSAIAQFTDLTLRDRVFFDLHCYLDDHHSDVLGLIAMELAHGPDGTQHVRMGMLMALNLRAAFFDAMLLRARSAPTKSMFTDTRINREGLDPVPDCTGVVVHRDVCNQSATAFSASRGHPVFAVDAPAKTLSFTIGELAPGNETNNHRHAYESLIYVLEGFGWTVVHGKRVHWRAGDAVYIAPWNWHQHCAGDSGRVRYLTGTNLPLLISLGQSGLREEAHASPACRSTCSS